jgi:hypothetical protein
MGCIFSELNDGFIRGIFDGLRLIRALLGMEEIDPGSIGVIK